MRDVWEKLISGLFGIAVVAMAISLVHAEFFPKRVEPQRRRSEYVADWRTMLSAGRLMGSPSAPVTIIEFSDFECPFCRRFNDALAVARKKYPTQIAVSYIHLPLPGHPQAQPAARASECAAAAGRFAEAVDFMFQKQDSLGKQPWTWVAKGAGVGDTIQFARCIADSVLPSRLRAGLALGKSADIHATPTVLLNGWRYGGAPSDTELVRAIGDILAGRKPYKDFPSKALTAH